MRATLLFRRFHKIKNMPAKFQKLAEKKEQNKLDKIYLT